MNPYLLADDLSGALEAGAAFRHRGHRVTMLLQGAAPAAPRPDELRVLSTETRNVPPAEAAAMVRRGLAAQRIAGAQLVFKKIDSTLRGPVAAEIMALIAELAPPLVVVCPATPAAGRTVIDGVLRVGGIPVAETEFRHDPGWPATESRVAEVLSRGGVTPVRRLNLAELRGGDRRDLTGGRGVLLSDAETEGDLQRLVRLARQVEPATVFVGAGGLAHAVAASASSDLGPPPARTVVPGPLLFVSGSRSERSWRQLERLRDECSVPLFEIGPTSAGKSTVTGSIARALARHGAAGLMVDRKASSIHASEPLAWLSEVVKAIVAAGSVPATLVATGGETAREICLAAGIHQLVLAGESEPGVVLTEVSAPPDATFGWVVIKPGGFGSDDVWINLFRFN